MKKKFLADKLKTLMMTKRKPNGDRYSYREVAHETTLTASYISHLVNGRRTKPSLENVTSLAKFFGVAVSYFYDETEPVTAVTDNATFVEIVAMRSKNLSAEKKDVILKMLEYMANDTD